MPSPAEREQWRTDNADLVEFIETPANRRRSRFIGRMYESFREWGSLTEPQTRATRNVMRELQGEVIHFTDEALAEDAAHIFNGTYTINDGIEHLTYQVYTVRRGSLQGKRIIKRQLNYGQFKGFAFLNRTGDGIRVWRSHAEDEVRNERYIVWARILISALHERSQDGHGTEDTEFEFTYAEGSGYTIQASVCCRRCNRDLTDPTSIALGIGPECRNREQEALTTAANPHEAIVTLEEVAGTVAAVGDHIAQSMEASDRADVLLSMGVIGEDEAARLITPRAGSITVSADILGDDSTVTLSDITPREQLLMDRITAELEQRRSWGPHGQRSCAFCGRNDFQSPQGRGRHVATCRRNHNEVDAVGRARATLASFRRSRGIVRDDGMVGATGPAPTVHPDFAAARDRLAVQRAGRAAVAARHTPGPRTPNLSQLGTLIGGRVWEQ